VVAGFIEAALDVVSVIVRFIVSTMPLSARYEIPRRLAVRLFPKREAAKVSPSGKTTNRFLPEVRARRSAGFRARPQGDKLAKIEGGVVRL
jgi:hypothetical protein